MVKKHSGPKRLAAVLLAAVLAAGLLGGCSGSGDGNKKADGNTIRITWWGNQLRNDTTMAMLEAYKEENAGVKFEAEFTDWSGYWDKMATQAASNNLPDIVQQDLAYLNQYQSKGQLADMTKFVEDGTLNLDDVNANIISSGEVGGKLYALVSGLTAHCSVYNADILSEAGLTMPEAPTYTEIVNLAKEVNKATGVKAEMPAGMICLSMLARDNGESFYNKKLTKLGVSDATVLEYFKMIQDAIKSDWGVSVDIIQEAATAGMEGSPLATGKAWISYPNSNQVAAVQAATDSKIEYVMFPKLENVKAESMYLRPSMYWSISESSTHKEECAKLINYYTNNEKAQDLLKAERGVPISSKMADYMFQSDLIDDVQKTQIEFIGKVTEIATPMDPPGPVGHNEVGKILDDLTDQVRYGQVSPEDAAKQFVTEGNAILQK